MYNKCVPMRQSKKPSGLLYYNVIIAYTRFYYCIITSGVAVLPSACFIPCRIRLFYSMVFCILLLFLPACIAYGIAVRRYYVIIALYY